MAEPDKGDVAFHIVMALCSDLAVHDEERLGRMQDTLARLLQSTQTKHYQDQADLRVAYDALLRLAGKPEPS